LRATPGVEHRTVNGEWSALQTLRHLVFVHDSWFRRCVLGSTALCTPLGLAPEYVPDRDGQGLDLMADPRLDEVVALRAAQAAELDEEWAHHGFCVRDLGLVAASRP
jgi:DinB superfamily